MSEWQTWHEAYDDPHSPLSQRLSAVRTQVALALDRAPDGPLRLLSLCAGDGRDVLPVLAAHGRGPDVSGRLVELDAALVARASEVAPTGLEVVQADAGDARVVGAEPVDVLLLCGIFGNVETSDVRRTVAAAPYLLRPGGTVIWTRHRGRPDLTPAIRAWVGRAGLHDTAFVTGEPPARWSVGAAVRDDTPDRLFTFSVRPAAASLG